MNQKSYHFPSATGVCEIAANVYKPEGGAYDTVLVIHHGMAEHQKRYLGFIEYLCDHGIAVYMHDMANHGASNAVYEEAGWFGARGGWKALVRDFRHNVRQAVRREPGKKIFVMGHSMGSFICRCYTAWYPADGFSGAIYMGTGGPNPASGAGLAMAGLLGRLKGKKKKSTLLDIMAFGTYGKKFDRRTNFEWLTRDSAVVDRYIADPYCGFSFTIQGMHDLIHLNAAANTDAWYESIPAEAKILLISGEMDPVGDYGKGVDAVFRRLLATGHTQVTCRLYPDCRHEILNELNRDEVMRDIVDWIREV